MYRASLSCSHCFYVCYRGHIELKIIVHGLNCMLEHSISVFQKASSIEYKLLRLVLWDTSTGKGKLCYESWHCGGPANVVVCMEVWSNVQAGVCEMSLKADGRGPLISTWYQAWMSVRDECLWSQLPITAYQAARLPIDNIIHRSSIIGRFIAVLSSIWR